MSAQRILYVLLALAWVVAWMWLVAHFDDLTALIGMVGPLGVSA
jgi:hypothetical protein